MVQRGDFIVDAVMTREEGEAWRQRLDRLLIMVSTPRIDEAGTYRPDAGSGVLVRIAGRDFVFTAGHVLDGFLAEDVATVFCNATLVLPAEPGRDVARIWFRDEPDVGVVELNPSSANYWHAYEPLTLDDLGRWQDVPIEERLLVAGFPDEGMRSREGQIGTTTDARGAARHYDVSGAAVSLVTRRQTIDGNPFARERSFHVGWELIAREPPFTEVERVHPRGVSGGPVLAVDQPRRRYVGITRSNHEDSALLCEPVVEVLRLLLEHEDAAVRAEVESAIRRLERS